MPDPGAAEVRLAQGLIVAGEVQQVAQIDWQLRETKYAFIDLHESAWPTAAEFMKAQQQTRRPKRGYAASRATSSPRSRQLSPEFHNLENSVHHPGMPSRHAEAWTLVNLSPHWNTGANLPTNRQTISRSSRSGIFIRTIASSVGGQSIT